MLYRPICFGMEESMLTSAVYFILARIATV